MVLNPGSGEKTEFTARTWAGKAGQLAILPLPGAKLMIENWVSTGTPVAQINVWNSTLQNWNSVFRTGNETTWTGLNSLTGHSAGLAVIPEANSAWLSLPFPDSLIQSVVAHGFTGFINWQNQVNSASALRKIIPGLKRITFWNEADQKWIETTRLANGAGWLNSQPLTWGSAFFIESDSSATVGQNGKTIKKTGSQPLIAGNASSSFPGRNLIVQLPENLDLSTVIAENSVNSGVSILNETGNGIDRNWVFVQSANYKPGTQFSFSGKFENGTSWTSGWLGESQESGLPEKPQSFEVGNAYPNPFNPSVSFSISGSENVLVTVYSVIGQEVHRSTIHPLKDGKTTWNLDAAGSLGASGLYWFRFESAGKILTKKAIFLK